MRPRHVISFAVWCQRAASAAAVLVVLAAGGARADLFPAVTQAEQNDFLSRLARMHFEGSMSLNWRNIGPEKPGFETQIQNEVYLADMYFGVDGPFVDGVPIQVEWNAPTANRGDAQLYQLNFAYKRIDDVYLQFGKFLVPFGRYNELYRPDQFLTVTRPLLYASPDSLDLVIRNNSPRPPVTAGYTDVGARASYYPPVAASMNWIPEEFTFYVVNGLGEATNRLRTFPNVDYLGVPSVPGNGTTIDFGHQDNNLADNNNSKSFGGRMVWALGDVRFPWPIPEAAVDLKGLNLGLSGMGGQYDLEGQLNYQIYGIDASFDYFGVNFSGEYVYSVTQFKAPVDTSSGTFANAAPTLGQDFEINRGYFVQLSAPIMRHPPIGERITGVLVFNQIFRRGPALDLLLNQTLDGVTYPSVNALNPTAGRATTRMDKYTAAVNYQLSDHFQLKAEYSYWTMGQASVRSPTSIGLVDIYQTAFSMVMGF